MAKTHVIKLRGVGLLRRAIDDMLPKFQAMIAEACRDEARAIQRGQKRPSRKRGK